MPCTNDPLVATIPSNVTTILTLDCTPYGDAWLKFYSNTLNGVQVTFKCNDVTPKITGVRKVLSQEFNLETAGQQFMNPPNPPRKAELYIPYDSASVVDPTKLRMYAYTIVDPIGWFPVPDGSGTGQFQRVYDDSGTRLVHVKIPSFTGQGGRAASRFVIVELN